MKPKQKRVRLTLQQKLSIVKYHEDNPQKTIRNIVDWCSRKFEFRNRFPFFSETLVFTGNGQNNAVHNLNFEVLVLMISSFCLSGTTFRP